MSDLNEPKSAFKKRRLKVSPEELLEKVQQGAKDDAKLTKPNAPLVAEERDHLELEHLKLENTHLSDELDRANDLHDERKEYANRLFWLIVCWLIVVVIFVALNVFFEIHDSVLIAFITSTTVSVIGLFVLVAKWLFPSAHTAESRKSTSPKKSSD